MFTASKITIVEWLRGAKAIHYWWNFGLLDVLLRYRRTILGPIWITLTFAISAAGLGFVYSTLFKVETATYIAYLISGLATWMFVSGLIMDGCTVVTRHAGLIKDENTPIFAHTLRSVTSGVFVFLHNAIIILISAFLFVDPLSPVIFLSFLGVFLITLNGIWITMLLGLICTRFRDLAPLITTIVNLMFLVTPVFWYRDMLRGRVAIADANPFFHLIEVVRAPIMGDVPSSLSYYFCVTSIILGFPLTIFVANKMEKRIPFWV